MKRNCLAESRGQYKKRHLTIDAIVRFTQGATKKEVKKFIKLGLLKKHRTDTFELSQFGMILGFRYSPRFDK